MSNHIHQYYPVFTYFANQLDQSSEWWTDKKVLDFGGNCGNILRDPNCTIKHENYYCLDISSAAIEKGREDFPEAHWHHYNRFNIAYNFDGNKDEPFPVFSEKFDVILIYSVFTSTSRSEMIRCINLELLPLLNHAGMLINTYLSLNNYGVLKGFLNKRQTKKEDQINILNEIYGKEYFYLIGEDIVSTEEDFISYNNQGWALSFYKDEEICRIFPNCEIKSFKLSTDGQRTKLVHHSMLICARVD